MEFGIEKYTMHIMYCRKRETTEGIELLNQESIRTLEEKENYMYLGVLEANTRKETKGKNWKIVSQTNKMTFRNQAL